MNTIDQLKMIVQILNETGMITDTELDETIPQIGFHTNFPTRDDEESYEEYRSRLDDLGYESGCEYIGGLTTEVIDKIEDMGFKVIFNDCEGLENEGVIWVKND